MNVIAELTFQANWNACTRCLRDRTKCNIRQIDVTDEAVINEFNGTEQIYERFQIPFGLY